MRTEKEILSHLVAVNRADMEEKALEGYGHAPWELLYNEQRDNTDRMSVDDLRAELKDWSERYNQTTGA